MTFYKHLTDGSGTLHEVPIRTVHVAAVDGEAEALSAAKAIFKRHWGPARWQGTAPTATGSTAAADAGREPHASDNRWCRPQ